MMKMKITFILILCCVALAKATLEGINRQNVTVNILSLSNVLIPKDQTSSRIVGGEEAVPNSFPHQVALLVTVDTATSFCGGSLISKRTVLTAAHCIDQTVLPVVVVLGAHRIWDPEPAKVVITTSKYEYHKKWNRDTALNDIAVVHLPTPVTLSKDVQIIQLATDPTNDYASQTAKVSGWGYTSDKVSEISEVLRTVTLPVISNTVCDVPFLGKIKKTHVCTSGFGSKGACHADSGGALVVDGIQMGIVSFGAPKGCEIGWPCVFTRVTSYTDWIKERTI